MSDEGNYICRAENSVGYVEALARLTVHCKYTGGNIKYKKEEMYLVLSSQKCNGWMDGCIRTCVGRLYYIVAIHLTFLIVFNIIYIKVF